MGWLDLLILFFCCIIEVFLLYDYFNNFFEIKIKRKYIKSKRQIIPRLANNRL